MKKIKLWSMMMLVVMALPLVCSCSKDEDGTGGARGGGNITVVVHENGTTSNGSIFSAIDDKNFYLDYIKYTVEKGHLVVSSYDKAGFKGNAKIVSSITYSGKTYEVLGINSSAFSACSELTSVIIPNSVTYIDERSFAYCNNLISVTLGDSVKYIGDDAFSGCGLTSINIPNSVKYIGDDAFSVCSGLTSITIPNSVTFIGECAFVGCYGLTSIKVESGNTVYDSREDCNAIIETATNTLVTGCKKTIIPNSVTSIGESAFACCLGLTSITIPNSVTSIGESAFNSCFGLTSITIPNSVTFIGEYAFEVCGLTSIHCLGTTPPWVYKSPFSNETYQTATLYVPIGSYSAYKKATANFWNKFNNIVEE